MAQLACTEFERRENLNARFPAVFADLVVHAAPVGPCACHGCHFKAVTASQ
jgi:hypothetical protein